ncbi:phosphatase PAP2 family protein [Streptomyces justiciae]|uniref:phosphatase PAP2 family protein n=1 Tax=Streptomyces justiciae TaxID=2780140 RepID=UPI001D147AA1|nr:phosphatase PAP2 family protein [Streptomyces justiciae]MCW8384433.1 phosphatase PAP2 family protein [Streptomyces justiciae]
MADLRDGERLLSRRAIGWGPPWVRRLAPVVQEAAENTRLWCATAIAMTAVGGWPGRTAAAAGMAAMGVAQVLSNAVAKPLCRRRRPPAEWVPPEELQERPDSSSFPSGHTAAAVAFAGGVAPVWPAAGAACGASAVMVAAQRVHSGAHYPFDVTAGGVIGLSAAALVRCAPQLLRRRLV